jgi:hypothetical protein
MTAESDRRFTLKRRDFLSAAALPVAAALAPSSLVAQQRGSSASSARAAS